MKRIIFLFLIFFFISTGLFAGGQQEGAAAEGAPVEKVSLRYMMWDPQILEKEEELAEKFSQQNPNVSVSIEAVAFNQYWEKMQAMAAARNMPDVFWMSSGYVKDYANMGAILNLDPYLEKIDTGSFFESSFGVLRAPNFEGNLYAFPWAVVTCISFYNKRMFDEAGLAYPTENWTWEEMRDLAMKLSKDTDGDGEYDEWGYWVKGRYTHLYPFAYNNGTQPINDDFTEFLLSKGAGKDAMEFLSDLIVKDKVSPTPAQTKGISKPFTTGKIGMCGEGSWRIDSYRSGLEDDFGINLVPLGPESEGEHVVFGWADAMSISAFTEHPEEAWEWMIFMSGPGRPIDSILGGKIPVWKDTAYSDTWLEKDQLPENKDLVLQSVDLIGPTVTLAPRFDEWNGQVQSDFDKIALGEDDFDAVMAELKKKVEKILSR